MTEHENIRISSSTDGDINRLVASFAQHEPSFASLGTPFLVDTETTDALIRMGAGVVPKLEAALVSDDPKIVMYVAYCLGLIGDDTALPTLQHTRAKYIDREPKQQYDFAVISAINKAEERLLSK